MMQPVGVLLAGLLIALNASGAGAMAGEPPSLLAEGEKIFARCQACHSLDRNRTGPRLCGVVGRPAGSVPDFRYSPAMQATGFSWNEKRLLAFIEDPRAQVPGTFMGYAGVKDVEERRALFAFLAGAASTPECAQ